MVTELYRKYRPKRFEDVVGQDEAVSVLTEKLAQKKVPHVILFTGSSGAGKTTLARILARKLGCAKMDFEEINCAVVEEPLKTVRGVQQRVGLAPVAGPCRVWLWDEFQALSRAGFAQQATLKLFEEVPPHAYFMLATTDPGKILQTVRSRCFPVPIKPLDADALKGVLRRVVAAEKIKVSTEVENQIVELANGSAREALQLLEKVVEITDPAAQLEALQSCDVKRQAFDLVRVLLYRKTTWAEVQKMLTEIDTSEPERLRHLILSCCNTELLKSNGNFSRALAVVNVFRDPFYECKEVGLTAACRELFEGGA